RPRLHAQRAADARYRQRRVPAAARRDAAAVRGRLPTRAPDRPDRRRHPPRRPTRTARADRRPLPPDPARAARPGAQTLPRRAAAHELCGGRLLVVAGGGYVPEAVARCWAIFLGTLAGPFADGTDPRLASLLDPDEGGQSP